MKESQKTSGVAIIGMACIFPEAPDLRSFWQNICNSVDAIGEPLPEWDAARYLETGRINTARGGYLKDNYRFDPQSFGIMPNSVDGGEPDQFLALQVARDALKDAGYFDDDYDHRDTGIILGHSTYLHRGQANLIQHQIVLDQTIDIIGTLLPEVTPEQKRVAREYLEARLPQFNADVAPSLVPNVMTGRVANRLNLRGPNYLVDAACSSSLLALDAAMGELNAGRSDMMLAGGVNASLPAEVNVIFTQLGALSNSGKVRPFSAGTDGTLLGEGLGIVVLKRYADALADGDRIYAVLKGVGQASDGKGQGLLAPSVQGEALAIGRAYANSEIDPASVGLIEAHGTGIPLGDQTEIAALKSVFGERDTEIGQIALGSIKSMISHCIPAAGIAGVIKTSLALFHKVLPPTICDEVNPELGINTTPFYVNNETRPWIHFSPEPRRAGVNAFGFGGVNAHAILEEAQPHAGGAYELTPWSDELLVMGAASRTELAQQLKDLLARLATAQPGELPAIAMELSLSVQAGPHRLALVCSDIADAKKKLGQAARRLESAVTGNWQTRTGICGADAVLDGKLAFLFPGEGSQYLNMFADLAQHFPEIRHWFEFWGNLYRDESQELRTDILFPPPSEQTEARKAALNSYLHQMDIGSEAVFIASQAMHELLKAFGISADVMVGHSTGESSALVASGAIPGQGFTEIATAIRDLNSVYRAIEADDAIVSGALLSVGVVAREVIEQHIAEIDTNILFAMENCHSQTVLFGPVDAIGELRVRLAQAGAICIPLPFDRGYHTPYFENVSRSFLQYYENIGLRAPHTPLYSCASAEKFPEDTLAARALAAQQWSSKVRFTETIENMYRDGARVFVEVGPSANLSSFVNNILADRDYVGIASNVTKRRGLQQLLNLLGQLFVLGRDVDLTRLYRDRRLEQGRVAKRGVQLSNTMPVLRLNVNEKSELAALLGGSAPQQAATAVNREETESVAPADQAVAHVDATDEVVAGYFDLMSQFLSRQSELINSLAGQEEAGPDMHETDKDPGLAVPFLDVIHEHSSTAVLADTRLSVDRDLFLRDHVLSGPVSAYDPDLTGLACVPLMVSIEIIAEACAVLADSADLTVIRDVRAMNWIALDNGCADLQVRARWADAAASTVFGELLDAGEVVVSGYFEFDASLKCPPLKELGEHRPLTWADDELYEIGMFHGPIFQSVRGVRGWSEDGIDAQLSAVSLLDFFAPGERPQLILNPVLLDSLGQVAAYWIAQQIGTDFNCFPASIERIELYASCPQDMADPIVKARQHPVDPAAVNIDAARSWDFECLSGQGDVLVRLVGLVNSFYHVPNRFYQVRRDPLNGWLGQLVEADDTTTAWQLKYLEQAFCVRSFGIFQRILALLLVGAAERDEWLSLANDPVGRREWLHTRACIKEAVRYWIWQRTDVLLFPADVQVQATSAGDFGVTGEWDGELIDAPLVTVKCGQDSCVSIVTDAFQLEVGVSEESPDYFDQSV